MYLLPKWVLTNTRPSINDTESGTVLEQTAKIYGAMNELITEYNSFADTVNQIITDFTADTTKNQNEFEVAIRQEFQDFIDVIEIKFAEQQSTIDEAVSYMQNNIIATTRMLLNDALEKGTFVVSTRYNEETENLDIVVEGEV